MRSPGFRWVASITFVSIVPPSAVYAAEPAFIGGEVRADTAFPDFMPLWREGWQWKDDAGEKMRYAYEGMPLGAHLFVYFRNTGNSPLEVADVLLEGVSLEQGIAPEHAPKNIPDDKYPSSLQFSNLPIRQLERLERAGQPVWWRSEPRVVPAGGYAQVTVRLRRNPSVHTLSVSIPGLTSGGSLSIDVTRSQPRFFGLNFTPQFDAVQAYLRHPDGKGVAPRRMLLDGTDVTARCTIQSDPAVDTVPVLIRPAAPLVEGTCHLFEALYADGVAARVCVGAWQPGLAYGMWGYSKGGTEDENRKFFLEDMRAHNINTLMYSIPGEVRAFLRTPEGREYSRRTGIRAMTNWAGDAVNPPFMFLTDEPDAGDFMSRMLDPYKRVGSLAQWLVRRADMFRNAEPGIPVLLNVDNTFKPENWYTYAQLADVPCADPYYPELLVNAYQSQPVNLPQYLKPTYVYGVGTVYQSAGAPRPMHLILHSCRLDLEGFPFRGPTPAEKRTEVYYALAAGAKAMSYWWYTPFGEYYGCGGKSPDMQALWKEIGLLGAEVRTMGDLITFSSPANLPVRAPRLLWVRTLLSGLDTVVLLVVNDNMASDRVGTVVCPVESANLTLQTPSWLHARDAFEVGFEGTRDVQWKPAGQQVSLDLGTIQVTRLVVITADQHLRARLQERYTRDFAANVKSLLAEPATTTTSASP